MNTPKSNVKKKIHLNPILKKDLRVTSRTMKFSWGLFAFEAVLTLIFLLAISIIYNENDGYVEIYKALVWLFPIIGATELSIVALIMPIETASAITSEREKQTFDILLTTVMTPKAIIRGKVLAAVMHIMTFIVASIPLMALSFTAGGISWWVLFAYLLLVFIFAYFVGSIGIFCSTITKKSIASIIISYVIISTMFGGTHFPVIIFAAFGGKSMEIISKLILLLNPVWGFIIFFGSVMGGEEFMEELLDLDIPLVSSGWVWVVITFGGMLLVSLFFQRLAARNIDPLKGYGKAAARQIRNGAGMMPAANSQPVQQPQAVPMQQSQTMPMQQPQTVPMQQSQTMPMQQSQAMPIQQAETVPVQQSIPEQQEMPVQQPVMQSQEMPIQNEQGQDNSDKQ
jgi:ABC-type transport system involved in multi-copper enzyme maturation permease subunit